MSRAWRLAGVLTIFAAGCLSSGSAEAARIEHGKLAETGEFANVQLITISGDLKTGDEKEFRRLSVLYDTAIVVLESNGGALIPAIEIGKLIRIKEYPTLVMSGSSCTSSCALIWVAGSKRFLSPGGRVGFHASYLDVNGRPQETGLGNALVGRYLTLLNLPEKAIIFATAASPDHVLWLNASNMGQAGIEFESFDDTPTPPPLVRMGATPIASVPWAAQPEGWVHVSTGRYAKYYLNRSRIARVGSYLSAWEKADHRDDPTVKYSEAKNLWYYDCSAGRMALKAYVQYDRAGKVTSSVEVPDYRLSWYTVAPESVGETKLKFVCRAGN